LEAQGFNENHDAAHKGGQITGDLVKRAETQGVKVVSTKNYLNPPKEANELPPE
jgi:hypothetical protein